MYCKYCGKEIDENDTYCSRCGKNVNEKFYASPNERAGKKQSEEPKRPEAPVTFGKAIHNYFTKILDCSGRSVRSEYWWVWLLNTPIGFIFSLFLYDSDISKFLTTMVWVLYVIYIIVSLMAGIPLAVRRLHDIGKSGSWIFVSFVPILGSIILLFMCAEDSAGDNEWGLSYRETDEAEKSNSAKYTDAYERALKNAEHKWRCKCGKIIFTAPCPFCGRAEENIAKQKEQIKVEEGFKKCIGCGAIIPIDIKKCTCGCKIFQDHI